MKYKHYNVNGEALVDKLERGLPGQPHVRSCLVKYHLFHYGLCSRKLRCSLLSTLHDLIFIYVTTEYPKFKIYLKLNYNYSRNQLKIV